MAQPLQRRRHKEPAKLPRLAARPRSLGPTTRPANMDARRNRKRTISIGNAIRTQLPALIAIAVERPRFGFVSEPLPSWPGLSQPSPGRRLNDEFDIRLAGGKDF